MRQHIASQADAAYLRSHGPRLHDLPHSHVTHMPASGVHVKIASERLGHRKVGIRLGPVFARAAGDAGGRGRQGWCGISEREEPSKL